MPAAAGQWVRSSRPARVTLRSFGRILHQLWLEVTGFVFLVLAAIGGVALNRELVKYQAGHGELAARRSRNLFLPDLSVISA